MALMMAGRSTRFSRSSSSRRRVWPSRVMGVRRIDIGLSQVRAYRRHISVDADGLALDLDLGSRVEGLDPAFPGERALLLAKLRLQLITGLVDTFRIGGSPHERQHDIE